MLGNNFVNDYPLKAIRADNLADEVLIYRTRQFAIFRNSTKFRRHDCVGYNNLRLCPRPERLTPGRSTLTRCTGDSGPEVAGSGGIATKNVVHARHNMQNRRKLHRIANLMVASFLLSLAACATPAAPGSLLAIKQEQQRDLYNECMRRDFIQGPLSNALPLRYIAEQCRAWAHAKAFSR